MNFAPMQPVRFWTGDMSIKVNPDFTPVPERVPIPHINLTVTVQEGKQPDGGTAFRCELSVAASKSAAEQPLPYAVEAKVIGMFAFVREVEIDLPTMRRMLAFNGVAMLYGLARDVIVQQTALGVHGPLILPAVNLSDFAGELLKGVEDARTAQPDAELRPMRRSRRRVAERKE